MKRVLLFLLLFLILAPRAAGAGGINLAWGPGCWSENPSYLKQFACNTNSGSATLTASFALERDQPGFVGMVALLDLCAWPYYLSDWWQFFNPGACRQTSLAVSADFRAAPNNLCLDPWNGLAQGGTAAYLTSTTTPPPPGPFNARLIVTYNRPDPLPLAAGTEYYAFSATFDYLRTVGSGACAGCGFPMQLVLSDVKSIARDGSSQHNLTPMSNLCVYWQYNTGYACLTDPVRNTTWGQVKGLYR